MNGYLYWHIAVEEYCKEIYNNEMRRQNLTSVLTSVLVMLSGFSALKFTGETFDSSFLKSYASEISLVLGVADMALFYTGSKRYRRWKEKYNQCRTDEKDLCCFLLACAGIIAVAIMLITCVP